MFKIKKIKKTISLKKVYWTKPENKKLVIFLILNKKHFDENKLKDTNEIFLKCSQYINTGKNPKNC